MLDSTRAAHDILAAAYRLPLQNGQPNMAAALEALADQVVPLINCNARTDRGRQRTFLRNDILAIAAQLRGGQADG